MTDKHWYIAIVAPNTERASADRLRNMHEVYLPSQKVVSVWKDGRRKVREKILLPGKLLIHCTEQERLEVCQFSFVRRFMVNIASIPDRYGRRQIAIVPDDQVERLRFLLGQEEVPVTIDNAGLQTGEHVRVIRGSLAGLEGIVSDTTAGATRIRIYIEHLGCASVEVNIDSLERM